MIDAKKVMKGLDICKHTKTFNENCMECPYIYDKRAKDSCCEDILHSDTIELLKSQADQIADLKSKVKESVGFNNVLLHGYFH